MNTILYLHGFASSGSSGTVRMMRSLIPGTEIIAPDIPVSPVEAVPFLKELVSECHPDLIVGTSMGAMYAELLKGCYRILVNPAFNLAETILRNNGLGRREFRSPRKDGQKDFLVTKGMLEEFREVSSHCFEDITEEERKYVYALFGTRDTLVDTYDLTRSHYPNCIHFEGEHQLNDGAFTRSVMPVIQWIDDALSSRSKPSVLVCFDDVMRYVHNSEMVSAGQKTILSLYGKYDFQFVIPFSHDGLLEAVEKRDWLDRFIGVPAWNHVSMTSRLDCLMADYLITARPEDFNADGFLGTVLRFGTDEFKNWDEVAVYFERLGGQ